MHCLKNWTERFLQKQVERGSLTQLHVFTIVLLNWTLVFSSFGSQKAMVYWSGSGKNWQSGKKKKPGAVSARENPLPLKLILYTTAPTSSGEVVSPAKPPLPGTAHFCTAMDCSTPWTWLFWGPWAQVERAEDSEAPLDASAVEKGYADRRQTDPMKVGRGLVDLMAGGFSAWQSKGSLCHLCTLHQVVHLVWSSTGPTSSLQSPCAVWICPPWSSELWQHRPINKQQTKTCAKEQQFGRAE